MAALAYPEIAAAGQAIAWGFQAIMGLVPAVGLAITKPWRHHHPDAHAEPHSTRRDITDTDPDNEPEPVPEMHYRFNGQHLSDSNEVGHFDRERKFISYSFQQWATRVYGHRYKFLSTVALAVARRRYRKWRLHGPYAQHTPLLRQIREEIDPFGSPRKRRRKYTRSQLYAL